MYLLVFREPRDHRRHGDDSRRYDDESRGYGGESRHSGRRSSRSRRSMEGERFQDVSIQYTYTCIYLYVLGHVTYAHIHLYVKYLVQCQRTSHCKIQILHMYTFN